MAKRFVYIGIAVIFFGFLWYSWSRHNADVALDSGLVTSHDTPLSSANSVAADSTDLDGRPMSDGLGGSTSGTGSVSSSNFANSAMTGSTGSSTGPAMAPVQTAMATPTTAAPLPASVPTTDSLPEDTANGMRFGGNGKYQWYRQGNITWRIDTHSGSSCIAFATMEEWQKPIVYDHGCGNA